MNNEHDTLDRHLQDAYRVEPPEALKQRLMEIPKFVPQEAPAPTKPSLLSRLKPAWLVDFEWRQAVPAMAVAAAVGVLWFSGMQLTDTDDGLGNEQRIAQEQAMRDWAVVMRYLNNSTARANAAVQNELGSGLVFAFERGEQSFKDTSNRIIQNGG